MFVYIHSTHVMAICNRFDICSSGKMKSIEGYPNRVASFGNANNVAERLRKMSIRFSAVIHTYNVLSHSWD